jgi:hypothetical protein
VQRLLSGEFDVEKGFYHRPLSSGDVFQFFYNSSGGYGDPIERDTELVRQDLDNEVLSLELALNAHHVQAGYDEQSDSYVIDVGRTEELRRLERDERRRKAVPTPQWIASQRERIERKELAPLVLRMLRESFEMSDRWRRDYIEFWGLADDFSF